jgi:hypothetical protein
MTCESPFQTCRELNALAETNGWPIRCACDQAFERPELNELSALWRSKAEDGVPARSLFGMRALKPFIRNVTIMELEEANGVRRYRFRLFGSNLTLLFGEHTGRPLDEMVAPDLLASWLAVYDTALSSTRPLRVVTYYRLPTGNYVKGEILAAPLADDAGEVRLVLAATYVGLQDGVPPPFG